MNEQKPHTCIDAGTDNCPCRLAETLDCLTCSRLQGREYCDCGWGGVCIFNEFVQGGKTVKNTRLDFAAPVLSKKKYMDDLAVFTVCAGKGFAMRASVPGSYVFIKAPGSPSFYNAPMSVMRSDVLNGALHIAVKGISAKTKLLFLESEEFILRGVYRNGIIGLEPVLRQTIKTGKILLITKGVGFAPGALFAEWMAGRTGIDWLIDTEKIGKEIVQDYLPRNINGSVNEISLSEAFKNYGEGAELKGLLNSGKYFAVIALTSDYYLEKIRGLLEESKDAPQFAFGNNFTICCGEGVCGACSRVNRKGETYKMCKCTGLL